MAFGRRRQLSCGWSSWEAGGKINISNSLSSYPKISSDQIQDEVRDQGMSWCHHIGTQRAKWRRETESLGAQRTCLSSLDGKQEMSWIKVMDWERDKSMER
jgi:hypothetical protein